MPVDLQLLTIYLTDPDMHGVGVHWYNELQSRPPDQTHAAFECDHCEYRGIIPVRPDDGRLYGACPRCDECTPPNDMIPVCPQCNDAVDIWTPGPPNTRASCPHCGWSGATHPKWQPRDRIAQLNDNMHRPR